jgi:hypothetical protein
MYVTPTIYNESYYDLKCVLDNAVAGIEMLPNTYILKPNRLRNIGKQHIKKTLIGNINAGVCNILHDCNMPFNWYRYIRVSPLSIVTNNINSIAYSSPSVIYGNSKFLKL